MADHNSGKASKKKVKKKNNAVVDGLNEQKTSLVLSGHESEDEDDPYNSLELVTG